MCTYTLRVQILYINKECNSGITPTQPVNDLCPLVVGLSVTKPERYKLKIKTI